MVRALTLAFLLSVSLSQSALAAILFGAEFELTNEEISRKGLEAGAIVNIDEAVDAQKALVREYTKGCIVAGTCMIEKLENSYGAEVYKVTFKSSGFWVQISTDPGTVEVQTKPSTAQEYERAKHHIDQLFAAGKKLANPITPHVNDGAGHIHIDFASAFGEDKLLFRNFLVDFMNHQELGGREVFGADEFNAPHLAKLSDRHKLIFEAIIGFFDEGKIRTSQELAEYINAHVYDETPSGWSPPEKYQALNLTRTSKPRGQSTVELRGLGPQRNSDEFLKQIRLFEARIEYLKKQKGKIHFLQPIEMSARDKVAAFRSYVEESGLKWEDYRKLVRNHSHLATEDIVPLSLVSRQRKPRAGYHISTCAGQYSSLSGLE